MECYECCTSGVSSVCERSERSSAVVHDAGVVCVVARGHSRATGRAAGVHHDDCRRRRLLVVLDRARHARAVDADDRRCAARLRVARSAGDAQGRRVSVSHADWRHFDERRLRASAASQRATHHVHVVTRIRSSVARCSRSPVQRQRSHHSSWFVFVCLFV